MVAKPAPNGASERRVSARILEKQKEDKLKEEKQREEKLRLLKRRVELLDDLKEGEDSAAAVAAPAPAGDDCGGSGAVSEEKKNGEVRRGRKRKKVEQVENVKKEDQEVKVQKTASSGAEMLSNGNVAEKSDHAKVKDTLRLFNKHYLHLVQEEEQRCLKKNVHKKALKKSKSKSPSKNKSEKAHEPREDAKTKAKRPDLKAISKNNEILFPAKKIGAIPGIIAGHQFYSRAEMVAVGFHSHWLNGIDYMGNSYSKEYKDYKMPIAVSIVLSGQYEDDLDNAEDVIYTGQGGHNLTGDKRQIKDQELTRGNLALKNCIEQCVPVRVVRGHASSSSYVGKVYTYDGLYKVVKFWAEKGISGFTVFKYRLTRLAGQPVLTTNQVQFINGRVPQSLAEIRGLVCEDISGGQEEVPIPATNLVDDPPVPPTGFTYCNSIQIAKNVNLPMNAPGCNCKGACLDPRTCACAKLNGSDFPYVHRDGGRLIEAKDVVFECGPQCGCGPDCINRTSQRQLKYRLEVCRYD